MHFLIDTWTSKFQDSAFRVQLQLKTDCQSSKAPVTGQRVHFKESQIKCYWSNQCTRGTDHPTKVLGEKCYKGFELCLSV
jgi:hypothetical protein